MESDRAGVESAVLLISYVTLRKLLNLLEDVFLLWKMGYNNVAFPIIVGWIHRDQNVGDVVCIDTLLVGM